MEQFNVEKTLSSTYDSVDLISRLVEEGKSDEMTLDIIRRNKDHIASIVAMEEMQGISPTDKANLESSVEKATKFLQTLQSIPATPRVPSLVTMRQARLALLKIGKLSAVESAIASMPSPTKEIAQIEWEYSAKVERDRALVKALAPALDLSEEEIDQLFVLADTL